LARRNATPGGVLHVLNACCVNLKVNSALGESREMPKGMPDIPRLRCEGCDGDRFIPLTFPSRKAAKEAVGQGAAHGQVRDLRTTLLPAVSAGTSITADRAPHLSRRVAHGTARAMTGGMWELRPS